MEEVTGSIPVAPTDVNIKIPIGRGDLDGGLVLDGVLEVPQGSSGLVVFAHGSGSSRHSPRNRFVAEILNQAGLATLLFDLLTPREAEDRRNVFDIALLGDRLLSVTSWLSTWPDTTDLAISYFGASTGAAAALWAAGSDGSEIRAVVSRGGRPDLAGERLATVGAPTLLIVGSRDPQVLELNQQARQQLTCRNDLRIIEGATHLFEEPGTLDEAAQAACDWFVRYNSQAG